MVHDRRLGVVLTSGVRRLANSNINIVVARFAATAHNDTVDITSSAAIDLVFLGCVTSVAWQVFLFILNLMSHLVCFRQSDCYK